MDRCLALTKRDRGRARGMLTRMTEAEAQASMGEFYPNGEEAAMKKSLQTMLMLGAKMEIQAIDDQVVDGGLCGWLQERMRDVRGF